MTPALSSYTFGCEFEVYFPGNPFSLRSAAAELSRRIGLPVDPHGGTNNWNLHQDGSIKDDQGRRTGIEFVSPILSGAAGIEQAAAVANALKAMGAKVNKSCGFHVHVGAAGQRLDFFKNLVKLYARYEQAAIDCHVPTTRRGNRADFCRSVALANMSVIDRATSWQQIASEIHRTSGAYQDRYVKLNLAAMHRHGTVEFRQHSGTVEAPKAVNWIIRCLQMVQAAAEGRIGAGPSIARDYARFALKTRVVIEMISRPEGASLTEICQRGGWERMGIKRHAAIAGFNFRKRGERYYIINETADNSATAVPVTPEGLDDLLGATPEQRAFFAERRAILARGGE